MENILKILSNETLFITNQNIMFKKYCNKCFSTIMECKKVSNELQLIDNCSNADAKAELTKNFEKLTKLFDFGFITIYENFNSYLDNVKNYFLSFSDKIIHLSEFLNPNDTFSLDTSAFKINNIALIQLLKGDYPFTKLQTQNNDEILFPTDELILKVEILRKKVDLLQQALTSLIELINKYYDFIEAVSFEIEEFVNCNNSQNLLNNLSSLFSNKDNFIKNDSIVVDTLKTVNLIKNNKFFIAYADKAFYANEEDDERTKQLVSLILKEDDCNKIYHLLTEGVNVNYSLKKGLSPLLLSVYKERFEVVILLILAGSDFTIKSQNNFDLLDYAVYNNKDNKIVKLLLDLLSLNNYSNDNILYNAINHKVALCNIIMLMDYGYNLNIVNKQNRNLLETALDEKRFDIATELVARGLKLEALNKNNMPIWTRILSSNYEPNYIEFLKSNNIKFSTDDTFYYKWCIDFNYHPNYISDFASLGVDVNANIGNESILSYAIKANVSEAILKELVALKASFFSTELPFHLIAKAQKDYYYLIPYILAQGFDINFKDDEEKSPLALALRSKNKYKLILTLINKGANLFEKNSNNDNLLIVGLKNPDIDYEVVKVLLDKSLRIDECNNFGLDAFVIALSNVMDPNIISLLIEHGAKVNAEYNGLTPIMYYVMGQASIDILYTLIKHEANLNAKSKFGLNALICCLITTGRTDIVKELLNYAPKLKNCKCNSLTPIQWLKTNQSVAQNNQQYSTLKYLLLK